MVDHPNACPSRRLPLLASDSSVARVHSVLFLVCCLVSSTEGSPAIAVDPFDKTARSVVRRATEHFTYLATLANGAPEPFEENVAKSQRKEGKIPRFSGYTPPDPRDPQSRKLAEANILDARIAHTLHTANQCTPRTPVPA